jgi:hypothetical protein
MSQVFAEKDERKENAPNPDTISDLLKENCHLIACITELQQKGRMDDALKVQKILHRNLVYLSCLAYPKEETKNNNS